MIVERNAAHDATNLFCRGRNHSLDAIVEAIVAHGDLHKTVLAGNPYQEHISGAH